MPQGPPWAAPMEGVFSKPLHRVPNPSESLAALFNPPLCHLQWQHSASGASPASRTCLPLEPKDTAFNSVSDWAWLASPAPSLAFCCHLHFTKVCLHASLTLVALQPHLCRPTSQSLFPAPQAKLLPLQSPPSQATASLHLYHNCLSSS